MPADEMHTIMLKLEGDLFELLKQRAKRNVRFPGVEARVILRDVLTAETLETQAAGADSEGGR